MMVLSFRAAFDKKISTVSHTIKSEEGVVLEKWVRLSLESVILEVAS